MSWSIRHEGSPRSIEGLSLAQVAEGLQDGLWEPTDEVMGPDERTWVPIESHPQLAEAAAEMEPPAGAAHDDETRLDMNPLIDVALVLLIFFILTTSYAELQKLLEAPQSSTRDVSKPLQVTHQQRDQLMIRVTARLEGSRPVIRVEDRQVDPGRLLDELGKYVHDTHKTRLLIDAEGVDWGTVVLIQDAAKGAGIERAYVLTKPPRPAP